MPSSPPDIALLCRLYTRVECGETPIVRAPLGRSYGTDSPGCSEESLMTLARWPGIRSWRRISSPLSKRTASRYVYASMPICTNVTFSHEATFRFCCRCSGMSCKRSRAPGGTHTAQTVSAKGEFVEKLLGDNQNPRARGSLEPAIFRTSDSEAKPIEPERNR